MENIDVNFIHNNIGKINIIDVREIYEFASGHIPTAKNIPMTGLLINANSFLDKSKKYYINCQSGGRSAMSVDNLLKQGYDVVNILGGASEYETYFGLEK